MNESIKNNKNTNQDKDTVHKSKLGVDHLPRARPRPTRNLVEERMIERLSVRLFLDTHPDLTPRQAVRWMAAEERIFNRSAAAVKA